MEIKKEKIKNSVLRNYLPDIQILSDNYPIYFNEKCQKLGIPINKNSSVKTVIDWETLPETHSFFYDYVNGEKQISQWLKNTPLIQYEFFIVEFGYNEPIISVKADVFIENWYDFVSANGFSGITCITVDGKLFFEFADDSDYHLRSNFRIKPNF